MVVWREESERRSDRNGQPEYDLIRTVKPLIMDTPKSGKPPYNGHTVCPLSIQLYLRRRDNL